MTCLITLNSGRSIDLNSPNPDDIDILDLVHSLSHIPRFNGNTDKPMNVAHHSILVSELVPDGHLKYPALMHDVHESIICDIPTPLKKALGGIYREIEGRVWRACCKKFKLPEKLDAKIKKADYNAFILEANSLFSNKSEIIQNKIDNAVYDGLELRYIEPLSQEQAKDKFLRLYVQYSKEYDEST